MVNRVRKNAMRKYHNLVHERKYLYQYIYDTSKPKIYYPENIEYVDLLAKQLDEVTEKIELLKEVLEL